MLEYRRTIDLSTVDVDWVNSELYAMLALKTNDAALASIVSLEEAEAKGIIGWQRLEREARGDITINVYRFSPNQTHRERVQKANKRTIGGKAI